jgi:plasmid stability protein
MADLSLKGLDGGLMRAVKVAAFTAGKSQREWIVELLRGAVNGDEQGGAEGGGGKDHGQDGADERGGKKDVRDAGKKARRLQAAESGKRGKGVRGMRGKDQGGERGEDGAGVVLGASEDTQSESGAVGGSTQADT